MSLSRTVLAVLVALQAAALQAHKPSDSYLTMQLYAIDGGERIEGRWDLHLRDLEHVLGVDADGDGRITWGELRRRQDDVFRYAFEHLGLSTPAGACRLAPGEQLFTRHSDGGYSVLTFRADCPGPSETLTLHYDLFFDADPTHRGLIRIENRGRVHAVIARADRRTFSVAEATGATGHSLAAFVREGVQHIAEGYDHLAFLILLLLPAVLVRSHGRWEPAYQPRVVAMRVVKIVTAFTLAHSLTLSLAALGFVTPPSQPIEIAIALSVMAAAVMNFVPWLSGYAIWIAFSFGLLHGFGFAGALLDLGLPAGSLALHLAAFNVGVEVGQLAIVAVLLPALYLLSRVRAYSNLIMPAVSGSLAIVAMLWTIQRI